MSVEEIRLFVQSHVPNVQGTTVMRINKNARVEELLQKCAKHLGLPEEILRVCFAGKMMGAFSYDREVMYLNDYGIQNESTIQVTKRLRGE